MTRESAISRNVLSAQVKERLLEAILDGRYPPGARIVETRVARELGTSQAPVREALRDLEALGVVETTGNLTLERVWRTLEPFSRTYITIVAPGADRRRIANEHIPVLDALRRRDPDLLAQGLHPHLPDTPAT